MYNPYTYSILKGVFGNHFFKFSQKKFAAGIFKSLLATLYNAPVNVDSYYSAQVRHEFGWGSRVDKN